MKGLQIVGLFVTYLATCVALPLVPPEIILRQDRATVPIYKLPPLPYTYDALEPYISRQIMELHYSKHHQAYVDNANKAEGELPQAKTLQKRLSLMVTILFNGGGHINHSLFWKNLAPPNSQGKGTGGVLKDGKLKQAIQTTFSSVDNFITLFNAAAGAIKGSGWGWLVLDPDTKVLEIITTANQDTVGTKIPIIGVDVWEHAYYPQYLNARPDYLKAIWQVINWDEAEKRFLGNSSTDINL